MKKTLILLVEDHAIVRKGIRSILEMEEDMEVVAEAQEGRESVALALELKPEVVLMDIAMPGMNGLEATRQILSQLPRTKVIMLSAHGDDAYISKAVESGASGFLLKQCSVQDVCRAIREVKKGNVFFSKKILNRLRHFNATNPPVIKSAVRTRAAGLTQREMEVLQLVAEGEPNKQIATDLSISIKTVEKHRASLMRKLNIHDTAGLTRYAISEGVIENSQQNTVS